MSDPTYTPPKVWKWDPGNGGQFANINRPITQPGDYYWLMDANASDGSAFQFGAIVNTAIDAHELNDAVSLSTTIPNI